MLTASGSQCLPFQRKDTRISLGDENHSNSSYQSADGTLVDALAHEQYTRVEHCQERKSCPQDHYTRALIELFQSRERALASFQRVQTLASNSRVSGLCYFCTDEKLRQAFVPFGTVVLAQVLRDEYGHSLGVGVVHMARCEDVARVFNADQRFEVSGSRVDPWEPADPETGQNTWNREKRKKTSQQRGRHIQTEEPSSRAADR